MALTITPEVTGQEATSVYTYCYLYEPLRVKILESNSAAKKIYIDIDIVKCVDNTIFETKLVYAEFDINPGSPIRVDLMNLAKQLHDSEVYKYGSKLSFGVSSNDGIWEARDSSVSRYRYNFKIYSDITTTPVEVKKLPLIGGRAFDQFTPVVNASSPLNEAEYYGVNYDTFVFPYPIDDSDQGMIYRWGLTWAINITLNADPNALNCTPSFGTSSQGLTHYPAPCAGGFLIWKSRFGGWMVWAFDVMTETRSGSVSGNIEVGMFETQDFFLNDSQPYVQPDYSKVSTGMTRTLKAYSLKQKELQAVQGINTSPAVYYCPILTAPGDPGKAELVKLTSASAPYDSKAEGGDFSVSIRSISEQSFNTR